MTSSRFVRRLTLALACAAITFTLAVRVQAQTETILHNFNLDARGAGPGGTLLIDSSGNLYGTTVGGGDLNSCLPIGCGVAFRLSLVNSHWQETVLRDFPNSFGGSGVGVISDAAGNLYGITTAGGSTTTCESLNAGCGVVFELSPTATGQWKRTVLHVFTGGTDGGVPIANVVFDAAGNLYGTTAGGGTVNGGVVYKLSPHFGTWTQTVLYNFTCAADGCNPNSPLVFDAAGNLYGEAEFSTPGSGVVFELSPSTSGSWTETVLYTFAGGTDGIDPSDGLVFDPAGNLYGLTLHGGGTVGCNKQGCGTVFELSPSSGGSWTKTILHAFTGGSDGDTPAGLMIRDSTGNLYGTALDGGGRNYGMVFELLPNSNGTWTEKILHSFVGPPDGWGPAGLAFDSAGNLYGATGNGGTFGGGVVYEITP